MPVPLEREGAYYTGRRTRAGRDRARQPTLRWLCGRAYEAVREDQL